MSVRLAATLACSTLIFGPPSIKIEPVSNPANAPVPGAVFMVTGHHHAQSADGFSVTGRAEGLVDGTRVTHALTLTPTTTEGVYGVTKQWSSGQPWVLVFTVREGGHADSFAVAEAAIRIDRDSKVKGIDYPLGAWGTTPWPRKVSLTEIETALATMAKP